MFYDPTSEQERTEHTRRLRISHHLRHLHPLLLGSPPHARVPCDVSLTNLTLMQVNSELLGVKKRCAAMLSVRVLSLVLVNKPTLPRR